MNIDRRLLSLAKDPWFTLLLTIIVGGLGGWFTIGQARLFSFIVDDVFLGGQTWMTIKDTMMILAGVITVRALLAWMAEGCAVSIATRIKTDLRARLLNKIHRLGPAFTRAEQTGELTTAAVEGIDALDAYFSQYLPQLILSAIIPLSVLIFVFPLDPLSGIILACTAPLIPLFMYLIGKGAERITGRQYEVLGRLSSHFLESLQGLTTLKEFGRSRDQIRSISESSKKFRDITLRVLRVTFLSALVLEFIATLSTAVVAVEVSLRLLHGMLPFDKALFILILAPEFYMPLRMLGLRFHAGMAGTAAAGRIYAILNIEEKGLSGIGGRAGIELTVNRDIVQDEMIPEIESIKLINLSFTYPGDNHPVLKNINLEILAGQHVALVGPSGGGKSTLAALLLGFMKPTQGQILVNGQPLDDLSIDIWRKMIGWVPEAPYIFHDTIAANLRIARRDAGEEEMETAVKATHLEEFIRSLPGGYETFVGEEGCRLSGGQGQRLALARAFLKQAPILVLDEPTSSLDPNMESLLVASINRLIVGRTVITIAHRLNTIISADTICVIREGSILEKGTHHELLKYGGVYARMMEALKFGDGVDEREMNADRPTREEAGYQVGIEAIQKAGRKRNPSSPVIRLLAFLQGSLGEVSLSVLLGTLTIAASIGLMGTSSWLITTAALFPSIAELNLAIVGVRFFGILRGISRYLERLISHGVTFNVLARVRSWFYKNLEPLGPRQLMKYHSADLLGRIGADVDSLENFFVRVVAPVLVALVVSIGTTFFLGTYHLPLGWTHLGFCLLLGLLFPFLTHHVGKKTGSQYIILRSEMRRRIVDTIQGLPDLIVFNQYEDRLEDIQQTSAVLSAKQRKMGWISGISISGGILLSNLGMWTVLALSIPLVSLGLLDGVMLPVLALITLASFEALIPLPSAFQFLSSSITSAQRLFSVVDEQEAKEPEGSKIIPDCILMENPSLKIRGLSFCYPGSSRPALQNLQFDLPVGHKAAVIGPSGAGKSTLVNLLLRFWTPPEGSIWIGGRDLASLSEDYVRRYFSVISQKTFLFHATIRENLLLAKPDAKEEEILDAARKAELHDFISSLPYQYETIIGERGFRLSGGERQRVAIARALLKNAPFLLLDEPIAYLDPPTGQAILENLLKTGRDASMLLITHRFTGLEFMDEIIVLNEGKVCEKGKHKELLNKDGLYHEMANHQLRIMDELSTIK